MFLIDPMSRQPVYEQLIEQTERFILSGVLQAGDQMPSVRSLSLTLSVNPNTIQKAYLDMDRRGILTTVPGKGCYIAERAPDIVRQAKRSLLGTLDTLLHELALAGVSEKEIQERIRRAYPFEKGQGDAT